jgi:hypothetical protein
MNTGAQHIAVLFIARNYTDALQRDAVLGSPSNLNVVCQQLVLASAER